MAKIQVGQSPIYYQGDSMASTFRPGDSLIIQSALLKDVQRGDIVVYFTLNSKQAVHRVLAVREEGLITCGDNNPCSDLEPVTQDNLIGIVMSFERNGKLHPALGGILGLLRFRAFRLASDLWKSLRLCSRFPYRFSIQKMRRLIERIWQPQIEQMTIILEQETVIKYLHSGRTVARWYPSRHYFECRKPYDLVIPNPEKEKPA